MPRYQILLKSVHWYGLYIAARLIDIIPKTNVLTRGGLKNLYYVYVRKQKYNITSFAST